LPWLRISPQRAPAPLLPEEIPKRFGISMKRAYPIGILLLSGLITVAAVGASPGNEQAQPFVVSDQCETREISRERLHWAQDSILYVGTLSATTDSKGEVLLAGVTNFHFIKTLSSHWRLSEAEVFGALIERDGSFRSITNPAISGQLGGVQVLARPTTGWDVIVAEVERTSLDNRSTDTKRLWHAVHDGDKWISKIALPLPDSLELHTQALSRLVRHGDTLFVAAPISVKGKGTRLALWMSNNAEWNLSILPVPIPIYADLGVVDGLGLSIVAVHPDLDRRSGSGTLFLWTRDPEWKRKTRLLPPEWRGGHPQHPAIETNPVQSLTWFDTPNDRASPRKLRVLLGDLGQLQTNAYVLNESAVLSRAPAPLHGTRAGALWVSLHRDPNEGNENLAIVHLEISRIINNSVQTLLRIPLPYAMNIASTVVDSSTILVAATIAEPDALLPYTSIIRLHVSCN